MNKKKVLVWILMLLPLLVVLFALRFLPERIPAHFGINGQIDRWGSKYEALIFPALSLVFGLVMLLVAKYAAAQEADGQNNAEICLLVAISGLTLFNILTVFFLYLAFHLVSSLSDTPVELNQLICGVLGIFLILLGNVLPKTRRNSLVGVRTVWSMRNGITWRKSQRFGGIALMVAGLLTVGVSCFLTGTACMIACLAILLCAGAVSVVYTWIVARANPEAEPQE